jgi:YD repeat-containing protein
MKTAVAVLALLCFPFLGFAGDKTTKGEVRDSSGKLIYKTSTRGNTTETRDASGKLVTKSKTTNGKTEVRSPSGKLLYKAK